MSKTPKEDLVSPVATQLTNYLKEGTINPSFIENQIQFKGIDRLQDLETILKIHFVLSDEVVKFMKQLPRRIRRIKTESKKERIRMKGEVRGKIDWNRTLKEQKASNNESIFVCQNPSKNYNVSENLVLKKLLSIIYLVLENELKNPIEENYEWLKGLRKEQDLINELKNIYTKNVHVNRIKNPKEYEVSNRDISRAENSRKELYKKSATLLNKYNKLIEGKFKQEELEKILNETLIIPGETSTLFELYSIFGLLKKLEGELDDQLKLKKIEKGSEEIAVFKKDETKILVYHDSTGDLNFFESIKKLRDEKIEVEFLERFRKASIEHADLIKKLLDEEKNSFYSGRPDIIIEYLKEDKLTKLGIGEIKYSNKKQTFSQGLKELIQYLYLARKKEKYMLNDKLSRMDLKGIYMIDSMEFLEKDSLQKRLELPFKLSVYDSGKIKKLIK